MFSPTIKLCLLVSLMVLSVEARDCCFYKANIKKGVQNRETWYIKDKTCQKLGPGYVIHDCTGYFNKKDCEHCLFGEDY